MPKRIDIQFTSGSDGDQCRGWFYPSEEDDAPVLVMAHGLGGVKEMRVDAYAARFSAEGYACLVFDYRHFGASDGQPRQVIEVPRQLEDWASGIAHVRRTRPNSKIILWGSSFAGGHVLAAAAQAGNIAAVVSQCPHTSGIASAGQLDVWTAVRVAGRAMLDLAAKALGRPPVMIPLSGPPGSVALMNGPGTDEVSKKLMATAGASAPPNEVAARIGLLIGAYSPGRYAKDLSCPILFCLCTKDNVAPASAAKVFARQARHGEVLEYPVGHFDIYMDEPFERVIVDQLAFVSSHVPVRRSTGTAQVSDAI